MKAIMYHYVREYQSSHPNFRFLDFKNFKKQLDLFESNFGFVRYDEWKNFINNGEMPLQKGKVLLTFDDAMHCHYEYVYPELLKRGLWGMFFVPTQPYVQGKLLDVHKIHLLCGAFNGQDLLNSISELISEDMIQDQKVKEFRQNTYVSQDNYSGVVEFKRLLNYFIDYSYRESLIDMIAKKFNYEFSHSNFYIHEDDLMEMSTNQMIIGSHTVTHPVMSKISKKEQSIQIIDSFKCLSELGVLKTKVYCHPFGGFHSFNKATLNILKQQNVEFAFNVESREISPDDISSSRYYLPRFDCNEFEFGEAS